MIIIFQDANFITEGTAKIFNAGKVFYNPVQEFNRDLSICVLNTFFNILKEEKQHKEENPKKREKAREKPNKIKILEALAATGLRSIRYAQEVEGFDEIIANDLSDEAVEMMKRNIAANGVEDRVFPSHADAM
jgi:tRNA (guanine26-N2/guanine27-N2)-dimethyltransferase